MNRQNLVCISAICLLLIIGCKMGSNTSSITNEQISRALVEKGNINNKQRSDEEIDFKNGIVDFTNKNIRYCFEVDDKNSAATENAASIQLMFTSTEPQPGSEDVRTSYGKVHLDLVKEGDKWQIKDSSAVDLRIETLSANESLKNSDLTTALCADFDSTKK